MSESKKRNALYPILVFFVLDLSILMASRLGLSLWQAERISAENAWQALFLQGLRIDISTLCWLMALPIVLTFFCAGNYSFGRFIQGFIRLYLVASSLFIAFMELATPAFINTYDFRPNRLFVEYLNSPKEVFSMLATGHTLAFICTPFFTALLAWGLWKLAKKVSQNLTYPRWYLRPLLFLLVGGLTFLGARSSLQHRAINPAMVAFSSDALINSLVLNSSYSLGFALDQMRSEANASALYGKMSTEEMLATLKQARGRAESDYISAKYPTWTENLPSYQGKPKNLVIILEESLGAQFIGALGDKRGLSPNLDALAKQGWWFENLYATGTRSVRGIEAVITGFTPTPARSVVKLPMSQHNFFTIAKLLKDQGYDTSFIYGGEKHFDNMASFFYGNGFDKIIDENDYANPEFKGTWGVSDEDLFKRANATFSQLEEKGKPFFSLVFTSSNHDPFEFPDGKIQLFDKEKATRNNAAKYADYAVGEFFKMAQKANYWHDTVFLVIADHDSRVSGASLVPIQHFHIPALILGEGIAPRVDKRLVSQMDMPTTLLSLIGVKGQYPMLGYDLTQENDPNRTLMQFDKTLAYRKGNKVAILQPKVSGAQGFEYDEKTHRLIPADIPAQMAKEALAYALWGSYAYRQHLYPSSLENPQNK